MFRSNSDFRLRLPRLLESLNLHHHRRAKPGARPGTLVVDPQAPAPVITAIQYTVKDFSETREIALSELDTTLAREGVTWINVDGLGDAPTIRAIGETFQIHQLVLEDIVNVHQRAKVEEFDDHLFIVARMACVDSELKTEQISLIVGPDYVVTFQEQIGDCLDPVRRRLRKATGRIRSAGADYLAYAILDAVIDGYFPVIDHYAEQLDALEDQLTSSRPKHVLAAIHRLRSEFYILRRAMWPHREMVNSLIRDMESRFESETVRHLRDCYDHTVQIMDTVDTSREIASDVRDFHYTQISIRQNEIMKVLTIVASIFIPLSFVTGLYGMNFDFEASPYNMPELHWAYGYPVALGVMTTMVVVMLFVFWRRGWLDN